MGPSSVTSSPHDVSLTASPARLRRAHQAVAILFFTCGFGFSNWSSRIALVREQLALSDRTLGFLLLSTGIGSMVSFRLTGALTRKYGSRNLALWGTGAFALLLNAAPAMSSVVAVAVSLTLLGVAAGFMDVSMNTQAVEVERAKKRPILSTLHGVCSLGSLMGAGTGAAAAFGNISLQWHILGISLPLFALVMWAGKGLLPPERMPASAPSQSQHKPRFSGVLLALGAIGFCSSVGEGAMANWLSIYLHENLHTDFGPASLGTACFAMAMLAGRLTSDTLSRYVPARQLIRGSGALVAVGLTFGLAVNTTWAIMVAALVCGLGLAPIIPAIFRAGGQLTDVTPSQALATLATMSYGGGLFGPPTIGLVAEHLGLRFGLGVVVMLALLLIVLSQGMPKSDEKSSVGEVA